MEQRNVVGVVDRVIHARDGWGVYDIVDPDANKTYRVKGSVSFREGERVHVIVTEENSERWGRQYALCGVESVDGPPMTRGGIGKFLVANAKGVGPILVAAIMETYEMDKLSSLLDEGDVEGLMRVPGVGEIGAKQIVEAWEGGSSERRAVIPLVEKFGRHLNYRECRTLAMFGSDAKRRRKFFEDRPWMEATRQPLAHYESQPYDMLDVLRVHRKSFEFVDRMIRDVYPAMTDLRSAARIDAGLGWLAGQARGFCTPAKSFFSEAERLMGVPCGEGPSIVVHGAMVYSKRLWDLEESIVCKLRGIRDGNPERSPGGNDDDLDVDQRGAVQMARQNGLCIIKGRAGTGKTTVIRSLCGGAQKRKAGEDDGAFLLAPTGKAATRITEKTGRRASTIHRLVHSGDGTPLRGTFIIDESSMLEANIFAKLLDRMDERRCRLILIGDTSQLPPVGRGRIFFDLVECGWVQSVTLTTVHRQKPGGILDNARVIDGCPDSKNNTKFHGLLHGGSDEFCPEFDHATDEERSIRITELVKELSSRPGTDAYTDVQVITPRRRGTQLCAQTINEALRPVLNPPSVTRDEIVNGTAPGKFVVSSGGGDGDVLWRVRDKVICTRNQYGSGAVLAVANGEQGVVNGVGIQDGRAYVSVHFFLTTRTERFWAPFTVDDAAATWNDLDLGYCISVHKSQGSEYRNVIFVIGAGTGPMLLNRKLLYTGVTRASEYLVLMGSREDVSRCMGEPGLDDADVYSCIGEKMKKM